MEDMVILDAANVEEVASKVDFVFCAVDMKKDEIKALEEAYAKAECPVVSNNSANRFTPDVPMVIPEINTTISKLSMLREKVLAQRKALLLLNLTAHFRAMFLLYTHFSSMVLRRFLLAHIRQFQVQEKLLKVGLKW